MQPGIQFAETIAGMSGQAAGPDERARSDEVRQTLKLEGVP
jgi:acetaldehyde dehydrogenase (acetylating)